MSKSLNNGMQQIQLKAIVWHVVMFVLPAYAVWQGLYLQRQVWFGLLLWSLAAIFFLFFVQSESLCLHNSPNPEPKHYLLRMIEKLLHFFGV